MISGQSRPSVFGGNDIHPDLAVKTDKDIAGMAELLYHHWQLLMLVRMAKE